MRAVRGDAGRGIEATRGGERLSGVERKQEGGEGG